MNTVEPTTDNVVIEAKVVKQRSGQSVYRYKVVDIFRWLPTELAIPIALCEVCGGRASRLPPGETSAITDTTTSSPS
jgi:hypothetical protein